MDAAIKIIKKKFEAFEGCELHSLSYVSDEECNTTENIACIVFFIADHDGERTGAGNC